MKSKMNLYKLLIALFCCVILAGLLITALTDRNEVSTDRNEALTDGWTQSGTCEWRIDDGVLTIRPLGDGREGTLADWGTGDSPWANNTDIISVVVKSGVKAATCRWMFAGCTALTALDLSGFDTSNVTDMTKMFCECRNLTSLDLSGFETSQVTNMYMMFYGCSALTALDLSSFETSQVTDMYAMFAGCSVLTAIDLRSFDTSQVTDMSGMFADCEALTAFDLRGFDTSEVTYMIAMFYRCSALTSLDLSSFDTSQVTDMRCMFEECTVLKELTLGANFNFKNTDAIGLPDPSNIAPYTGKWANGTLSLTAGQLIEQYNGATMAGTWVWETERNTSWTQSGTCEWKIDDGVLTIRPLGDGREGTLADWGIGSSPWVNNFDIISVVVKSGVKAATCRWMFYGCRNLTSLDLSSFDTSQVTDMSGMFYGCAALTTLDLSSFDTSQVTDMDYMFRECNALKELTLGSNFNFKSDSCLTDPSNTAPYTGKWANGELSLTAGQLTKQYNGSAMAGTWVWERSGI